VPAEEWERTAPDHGERPDQAALGAERRLRIRQALDTLPPNARTIIMLSDVEGLSYREIASVLNCPIGTVMSRLHNARKRLRSALGPMLLVLVCLAAALAGFAAWSPASGQAPPSAPAAAPPKGTIHFEVRVLQASNPAPAQPAPGAGGKQSPAPAGPAVGQMDERLKQIVPRLSKLFRYSDYTPLEHHKVDVGFGASSLPAPATGPEDADGPPGKSVRMQRAAPQGREVSHDPNTSPFRRAGHHACRVVRHHLGDLIPPWRSERGEGRA
jgi:hypothetical protein